MNKYLTVGQKFGELEVLQTELSHCNVKTKVNCKCTVCGATGLVRIEHLLSGASRSCLRFKNRIKEKNGIITIFFHSGQKTLIDKEDYDISKNGKFLFDKSDGYARITVNGKQVRLHREISKRKDKNVILSDHKNNNRLDNRRENLRETTFKNNARNVSKQKTYATSIYMGVHKIKNRYISQICPDGKRISIGSFIKEIDAAKAYDKKAREIYGEFANTNEDQGLYNQKFVLGKKDL